MSDDVIKVSEVDVRFGGVAALSGVNFSVKAGSVHAIIGPNGAGKSTCFNVISGVYRPTSGVVKVSGVETNRLPLHAIAQLGISRTFQNIVLAAHETVETNLMVARHRVLTGGVWATALALPAYRLRERRHRNRVREIAELAGLGDHLSRRAGGLPYGLQKRVEFARALCAEPSILMLDEPVAGMNATETADMETLINTCHNALSLTTVVIEHDMGVIMRLADTITVLDFGRVVSEGTPDHVRNDAAVIEAYLGASATWEVQDLHAEDAR